MNCILLLPTFLSKVWDLRVRRFVAGRGRLIKPCGQGPGLGPGAQNYVEDVSQKR